MVRLFAEKPLVDGPGGTRGGPDSAKQDVLMGETFGRALRRLREQAGLSQPELARRVPISQSSLSRYEGDRQLCDSTTAERLDTLLGAAGALRALLEPVDAAKTVLTPDDCERLAYVAERPRAVDAEVLGSLAVVLAESRHMEDRLGARIVLEPALGYMRLLERLTLDAHGSMRPHVVDLAGQWAQFTGWLHTATEQVSVAARWFDRALEWAIEVNNPALQANALTFKGNLAWMTGHAGPMIGLSRAAQRYKSVYAGQLAFAAAQEARGHAATGDRGEASRMLGKAEQCAEEIPTQVDHAPPWNYDTPALITLECGLVQRRLGHNQAAADLLMSGMDSLPIEQRGADWVGDYRRVLTEVQAGL